MKNETTFTSTFSIKAEERKIIENMCEYVRLGWWQPQRRRALEDARIAASNINYLYEPGEVKPV